MASSSLSLPPTPPDSPTPPAMAIPPGATLPARINTATRQQHTELNRLLMSRLPLALPPHAETPLLFSRGIVPFARIFTLLETEWDLLIRHALNKPDAGSLHEREVRKWLAGLRPPGLARSHRLKNDLKHLRTVGGTEIYNTPDLGEKWTNGMRNLVRQKPHVFVAFAWVFYMAIFSGGRWIRQQLSNGGSQFWLQQSGTVDPGKDDTAPLETPGISFLSFDGDEDGEDIKALFKTHLSDAEALLTPQEQQEVIDAARQLFDRCILLVTELDRMMWRQKIESWTPWILVALSFLLLLAYGSGQIQRFAGLAS